MIITSSYLTITITNGITMLSRVTLWTIPWTVIIVKFNYKLINLANIRDLYLVVSCVCNVVWCKVSLRTRVSNRSVRAQTIFIQQDCQTEENCRGKIQLVKSKTDCFCLFLITLLSPEPRLWCPVSVSRVQSPRIIVSPGSRLRIDPKAQK